MSEKFIEKTVNKLTEIINKELINYSKNNEPFQFIFSKNTDLKIIECIVKKYKNVGWKTEFNFKNESYILTIENNNFNEIKEKINETKEIKNILVDLALQSPEGRVALCHAITEPIKVALTYQSLLRKTLLVDELPKNTPPIYQLKEDSKPIYWSNEIIKEYSINEETLEDFSEIECNQIIKKNDLQNKNRSFYLVDRAQEIAKNSIKRQEDCILFSLLNKATTFDQTIYTYSETINRAIEDSIMALEEENLIADKIIVHPQCYKFLRKDINFRPSTQEEIINIAKYGYYKTLDIHVSTLIPKNTIYILPPQQFLGIFAIRQDITVLPTEDLEKLTLGWMVFEKVFPVIINNQYVRKVVVKS